MSRKKNKILKTFSTNLKELRINKNLSQLELSFKTGISLRIYQRYEYGNTNIGLINLYKLATFFNMTIDELIS